MIVDSLGAPGPTAYPPPTSPPASVSASGTVPETLLAGPGPERTTFIVIDSTRQLRVQVPASWQDVRIIRRSTTTPAARPRIVASLHIDTMLEQWEVPGLVFLEFPYVDAGDLPRQPEPRDVRVRRRWRAVIRQRDVSRACSTRGPTVAGPTTRLVTVVVSPPDNSATLSLEVQLPTADDTALRTVLASFGQL